MQMMYKKVARLILLTSLCLFTLLVMEVEAEESFDISLKKGWNLVSIPIKPLNPSITQVLQSIQGNYRDSWEYVSADLTDPWKHYHPDYAEFSDLEIIEVKQGFWIEVNQDCILTITGDITTTNQQIALRQGWNLIGWPFLYTLAINTALSSITFSTDYIQVSRFNPITKTQENYFNSPSTNQFDTLEPGKAYWIYCVQASTLILPVIPQISIKFPKDGSFSNNSPINVSGFIDDDNTSIIVNGVSATVANKTFSATVFLAEGPNEIIATATNQAGNTAEDNITVTLDLTPPSGQITSPLDGSIVTGSH